MATSQDCRTPSARSTATTRPRSASSVRAPTPSSIRAPRRRAAVAKACTVAMASAWPSIGQYTPPRRAGREAGRQASRCRCVDDLDGHAVGALLGGPARRRAPTRLGSSASRSPPPRRYPVAPSSSRSSPGQRPRLSRASRRSAGSRPIARTPAALAPEAAEPMRAPSRTVTGRAGSARRRWKAALSPMSPPPTITIDMAGASAQPRDHALGEEPHRAEHALVGDAPADVHPDGQRRVAESLAQLEEALR